jgi:hypothetical protein
MRVSILNHQLTNSSLEQIFLNFNCYIPDLISYMITTDDMKYIFNNRHDKYIFYDLMGGILMDPWNSTNLDVRTNYGNDGLIPGTVKDIIILWISNRKFSLKKLNNLAINKCHCGNYIYLDELDITRTPEIPTTHKKCLGVEELDNLCDIMNGKINVDY